MSTQNQLIQDWFKKNVTNNGKPFLLSDEQADVIADEHKNLIVTARAGSGKTSTIVAKIVYLIAHEGLDPDEIITFAFNRDAKEEINERLKNIKINNKPLLGDQNDNQANIATTFHSFAARSRSVGGEILSDRDCDDNKRQSYLPNRSFFIQSIIKEKLDKNKVLRFVREGQSRNNTEVATSGALSDLSDIGYFETLNGEIVRSYSEKIIADYCFEHDIDYLYEKYNLYPSELSKFAKTEDDAMKLKRRIVVRPDFYLPNYNIIWEHWGISGHESPEEITAINDAKIFSNGYRGYLDGKKWKEWFYARDWLPAEAKCNQNDNCYLKKVLDYDDIITTYRNPLESREEFEKNIEEKLAMCGIRQPRLSDEAIANKLLNNENRETISRLTEQITSFIDKAEQMFMSNYDKLHELCKKETNEHVALFYELALQTLDYYNNELKSDASDEKQRPLLDKCFEKKYVTDFSMLLDEARLKIARHQESPKLKVDGYKYIFIDEYQDFSELFYGLIQSLRSRSNDAKMMVVGDDWQAINSYAGSDLKFFDNFENYFPDDCHKLVLLTNHRSSKEIVDLSNWFMKQAGVAGHGGKFAKGSDSPSDALQICQVTEIHKKSDTTSKRSHENSKYDLVLKDILKTNKAKTITILSRKKKTKAYGPLSHCKSVLKQLLERDDFIYQTNDAELISDKISVSTVNSAKGCEADVVVILETDSGSFPVIHPDTELYRVFGEDKDKMIDEQKRLFYVAITRPKEKLYIIHEKEFDDNDIREDNFLTMLNKDKLLEYQPKEKALYDRILAKEIRSFVAKDIIIQKNTKRPENKDFIIVAANNEEVRQFNANAFRDAESCEVATRLQKLFREHPNTGRRVYVDVQEGKWIHLLNGCKK